jgi:hypothetical protein
MADKYQSSANKSNRKLQVMQATQLGVPLPLVEMWKELQPQVERLSGMAELQIIRAVIGEDDRGGSDAARGAASSSG